MKTEQEILFERDRMRLNQSGLAPQETLITKMMKEKHGPDWWRDDRVWLAAWWQHNFEMQVGPRNWHIRMNRLAPSSESSLSTATQEKCIAMLKSNPDDSYLMLGPAGCSKTTYTIALYDNALREFRKTSRGTPPFWFRDTKGLLDQFVNYARNPDTAKVPKPNANLVKALFYQGERPRLFLEEMDKAKVSEYKLAELFDLINAIYNHNGQIVVTSNLTKEEFVATFDAPVFRRLTEMKADGTDSKTSSHFWDFYKYKENQQ